MLKKLVVSLPLVWMSIEIRNWKLLGSATPSFSSTLLEGINNQIKYQGFVYLPFNIFLNHDCIHSRFIKSNYKKIRNFTLDEFFSPVKKHVFLTPHTIHNHNSIINKSHKWNFRHEDIDKVSARIFQQLNFPVEFEAFPASDRNSSTARAAVKLFSELDKDLIRELKEQLNPDSDMLGYAIPEELQNIIDI